jgi:hypothetical protein
MPMYDLIRPSFSTLVELEIDPGSVTFDLLPLRPVGRTLRKFVYKVDGFDPDILDIIPDVFPHLTTLHLMLKIPLRFPMEGLYSTSFL